MPRMLIVDDDTDVRLFVENVAAQRGWEFDSLCDGEAGWALLTSVADRYDLIVLDLRLPGHTGEELISVADKVVSGKKVVAVTGTTGELKAMRERAINMWQCVRTVVYKPFSMEDIVRHMEISENSQT